MKSSMRILLIVFVIGAAGAQANASSRSPKGPKGPKNSKSPKSSKSPKTPTSRSPSEFFTLAQSDFDLGTVRILTPGTYTFVENVIFSPNENDDFLPTDDQLATTHPLPEFQLGFFAGISVEVSDVVIDLDGHSFGCSDAFMLQQRIFALIELASVQYLPGTGPLVGVVDFRFTERTTIKNGFLGPSPHHGIHGNNNSEIEIKGVEITEYEIAGVQFNGATDVTVKNCLIGNTRTNVPVIGTFTSGRFLRNALRSLDQNLSITFADRPGQTFTVADVLDNVQVQEDIIFNRTILGQDVSGNPLFDDALALYDNPSGFPDGSAQYGIIINSLGAAVAGFGKQASGQSSVDVTIKDVTIQNLNLNVREVVALFDGNTPLRGFTAELFDIERASSNLGDFGDNFYVGNAQSDAQIAVAFFAAEPGALTGRTVISPEVVTWAVTPGLPLANALGSRANDFSLHCNGDHQEHVLKGPIGFRGDFAEDMLFSDVSIKNIVNHGPVGKTICGVYTNFAEGGHPAADNSRGYQGASARGASFIFSDAVVDLEIEGIVSMNGRAYPEETREGCSIQFDLDVQS